MRSFIYAMLLSITAYSLAQPVALESSISIRKVLDVGSWTATRVDFDPATKELYYAAVNGDVYKVNIANGTKETIFTSSDHGLSEVYGFEIGTSGNIYLVSMNPNSSQNEATVKKYDGTSWTTMVTATYQQTSYQHRFNAVIETQDQQHILVNSGANTDHGEAHNGKRDYAFTAMLLKIPVDTENLVLQDDKDFMKDYIYADGLRNCYDVEYDAEGLLFGLDQGPQGDHHEEMNWLEEGKHYGFPWRMGVYDNPQQFPDYDPNDDVLLLSNGIASIHRNDPDYPAPPSGVTFVDPVINKGPHQDLYRDPETGDIKDASEDGGTMGTFTPHCSPVGLTFDVDGALGAQFNGKAFGMTWSAAGDRKIIPFNATVEDLLMVSLQKVGEGYEASFTRIAEGFNHPVDACLINNKMYIVEHGGDGALWEVTFPTGNPVLTKEDLDYDITQSDDLKNKVTLVNRTPEATIEWDYDTGTSTEDSLEIIFETAGSYFISLEATSTIDGSKVVTDAVEIIVPEDYAPLSNREIDSEINAFPNPFGASISIKYVPINSGSGEASIFSVHGKKVKSLWKGQFSTNKSLELEWNGKNDAGTEVSEGTYILKFKSEAGDFQKRLIKTL